MNPASIPLFTPAIRGNEWKYVQECLDTAWVSSVGSFVDRFERMVAESAGVAHAVAVTSGTAGLHTALLISGIAPGDEVLVSTLTFIASANAIRHLGAHPVLIDAEPDYAQMDANLVEHFLRKQCEWIDGKLVNRQSGRRVRGMMPVHVLGHPVDMQPLLKLADQFELVMIEDAAEGLGVQYYGQPVGSFGRVGVLSFNGNKLITTGGGGMVLTNDESLARRARYLTTQAKDDPVEFVHGEVGYNYRLTNLQAAVGCGQLECLPEFIVAKQAAARAYREGLAGIPGISFYAPAPYARCTFWMNTIRVRPQEYGASARQLLAALGKHGIQCRPLWQPMHQSPAHRECQSVLSGTADQLHSECLNIPSSVGLPMTDLLRVCETIRNLAEGRCQSFLQASHSASGVVKAA